MTVSWFRTDHGKVPMKEAVKVLNPPKISHGDRRPDDRSRFSQLLLEHGEKPIQDWAVIAYTSPCTASGGSSSSKSARRSGTTQWAQSTPSTPSKMTSLSTSTSPQGKQKRSKQKKNATIDKDSYPSAHMTKIEGRLHLCSLSIVFEPTDTSRGIVRCPLQKMDSPPKEYPSDTSASTGNFEPMCVQFRSSRHIVMKANNKIGPFEPVAIHTNFRFTFLHSSPSSFVGLCRKLFKILNSEKSKPGSIHQSTPELEELLRPMFDRPFDPTNLVDVRERPLTSNLRCNLLTPLQSRPGCVVLTAERLYFQPASGVLPAADTAKATSWLQSNVAATARRYHGLRDSALEIYWKDNTSVLLAFERRHEREQVLRVLPFVPCHTDRDFVVQASREWQKGSISNYEYLLLLNSAAGRTFQDLSRYPVFPWVIADYESSKLDLTKESTFRDLSKPVGALNEDRLHYFLQRFESMQDMEDPFLYGTHYSAAGYVLYYLVRSMPEHMLCLQNGKFDAPDRMFHTVSHCFNCVRTNHADVKELIPQFYNTNNDFDFLINARSLQLGATQNGDRVNDVILPPWAKSARDFLKKNRNALESDRCTEMLPRWIDLIFGSKSRGHAARESLNLFHKMAYLGPEDLANMQSEEERFQAELQATEFGIVPDQLFSGPHPLPHETVDESFIRADIGRTFSGDEERKGDGTWELLDPPSQSSHDDLKAERQGSFDADPASLLNDGTTEDILSRQSSDSQDRTSQVMRGSMNDDYNIGSATPQKTRMSSREISRSSIPLSGSGDGTDGGGAFSAIGQHQSMSVHPTPSPIPSPTKSTLSPASAQAAAMAYSEWDMKIIERMRPHEDTVSGCFLMLQDRNSSKRSILATTSLDGGLKVHNVSLGTPELDDPSKRGLSGTLSRFSYITMNRSQITPSTQTKLTEFRSHTSSDPLACLTLASDGHGGQVAFAGGHDDVVLAYGINSACAVASVYSHRDAVTGLDLLPRRKNTPESALWLENSTHIMVSGSWDATIKVWSVTVSNGEMVSINREPLAELFDADSSIVCVAAAPVPGGGIVIGAGCADGSFCVWNLHNDGVKVVIHNEPARRGSGPCSVVQWARVNDQLHLFTGFATGKVASFTLTLTDGMLRKASAVSVGVAVQCLVYSENILLVGCADGGLRLIPVRTGAYFDSNPTLWPSVNSKSSPGISSISITYVGSVIEGTGRCICCTGAEDGTIALFELKKQSKRL